MGWESRIVCGSDDREAWLAARRRHVTGSEVAALFGAHEYVSLETLRREKTSGVSLFDATQDHVVQGTVFETAIAEYFRQSRKLPYANIGKLIEDPVEPALAATPDGVSGSYNAQIKFTKARRGKQSEPCKPSTTQKSGYAWGPFLPAYIWYQVQAEMAVLELQQSYVIAYHRLDIPRWGSSDDQLGVYLVIRDDSIIDQMRKLAREFVESL